jgi:hypothetical protein
MIRIAHRGLLRVYTSRIPLQNQMALSQLRVFSTEKVNITFVDAEGESKEVSASIGQTLLDVAHENDIELEGILLDYCGVVATMFILKL